MADLAKQHGVKRTTVSSLLKRTGIAARERKLFTDQDADLAVDLYGHGWSLMRISERLGFDHETIRRHLKLRGVLLRGPNDRA